MINHWTERTLLLLNSETYQKLVNSSILIVGLGGVGGYAAETIARAGVTNITIIDADIINPSNINRQIIALHSNIGQKKTIQWAKRIYDINPQVNLTTFDTFFDEQKFIQLFNKQYFTYIIDAIDTFAPKIALIKTALGFKIPIISSMGSGGRIDPTKITVADISKTYNCPMAKKLRKKLHKIGIYTGFKVVFSTEQPSKDALLFVQERNKKTTLGTISYIPGIFGLLAAGAAIYDIIQS